MFRKFKELLLLIQGNILSKSVEFYIKNSESTGKQYNVFLQTTSLFVIFYENILDIDKCKH